MYEVTTTGWIFVEDGVSCPGEMVPPTMRYLTEHIEFTPDGIEFMWNGLQVKIIRGHLPQLEFAWVDQPIETGPQVFYFKQESGMRLVRSYFLPAGSSEFSAH